MNKLRLRELAEKFHLPYSVAKKIVKGIKGRGVSIVRMRNEPSNVGYRGWGDAPVAKIERGSKRSPFADLLHEAGHVDAGHLGSKANRGSDLLKGAEGSYPRAHHESGGDILSAARSVLLKEKQANRAAGKILKDSGASPEQISAFAQEQRKNFRTYRKNAWRHAVAGERIKNPSATESHVMGVLQRQAARRGVIPSDGALRSARESVQRQIRMNPINRGRDQIFGNESFGVDGSKSILPLTISEAKRIHKNTSKLWRVREFSRGEYLRRVLGGFELIPARGAADAKKGAEKLRYYRSNPAGKEIDRVRKEILSDPDLAQAYRYKDTPGLTVVVDDEAHHFPKRSRDTKYVIDNLNKHAARGKSWSVGKGMLGQPIVKAKDIDRILSAKLRLRELAVGSLRLVEMGYTKPGLRERIKARIMASSKGGRPGQWSARKAQLVAQEYRAEGGGYKGGKTESQKSLRKWTREKWGTRSGKPSTQGPDATGERYLPEKAHKSLSPQEYGATTRAKREGSRRGEQFVKQPERIAKKTARHR